MGSSVSRANYGLLDAKIEDMTEILRIDGASASVVKRATMESLNYSEVNHLESWIKAYPEVIDASLMVITTQFDQWESDTGQARERPDVLALSSNGQLVVIELKRGSDRKVPLQAITYAALASGFKLRDLARAHAAWMLTEHGEILALDDAEERLTNHVDEWRDDLLAIPRVVVVAESFPPQVLTTVQWLDQVAPALTIECHEYTPFVDDAGAHYVAFNRLFPIEDLADRVLRPASREVAEDARTLQTETKRRARSVSIISAHHAIPDGSRIDLKLAGHVLPESVEAVDVWLSADSMRADVRWTSDPTKPLIWAASEDPQARWTPSALRNEIFRRAGAREPNFSAADAWSFGGHSLYEIAKTLTD